MNAPTTSKITSAAAEEKDWSLDATVERLGRAADQIGPRPSGAPQASFEHDGVLYARHGRTIVVGDRGYRLAGTDLACYFFRRITEATL